MSENEKYVCIGCVERSSVAISEIERLQAENERLRFEIGGWDGLVVDLGSKVDRLRDLLKLVVDNTATGEDLPLTLIEKELGDE